MVKKSHRMPAKDPKNPDIMQHRLLLGTHTCVETMFTLTTLLLLRTPLHIHIHTLSYTHTYTHTHTHNLSFSPPIYIFCFLSSLWVCTRTYISIVFLSHIHTHAIISAHPWMDNLVKIIFYLAWWKYPQAMPSLAFSIRIVVVGDAMISANFYLSEKKASLDFSILYYIYILSQFFVSHSILTRSFIHVLVFFHFRVWWLHQRNR